MGEWVKWLKYGEYRMQKSELKVARRLFEDRKGREQDFSAL